MARGGGDFIQTLNPKWWNFKPEIWPKYQYSSEEEEQICKGYMGLPVSSARAWLIPFFISKFLNPVKMIHQTILAVIRTVNSPCLLRMGPRCSTHWQAGVSSSLVPPHGTLWHKSPKKQRGTRRPTQRSSCLNQFKHFKCFKRDQNKIHSSHVRTAMSGLHW